MTRLAHLPLRTRLVAGFTAAMLVVLVGAGAFVYWRVQYALDRGLDTDLDQAAATIAPLVTGGGSVSNPVAAKATGVDYQVLDADGRVLASGGAAGPTPYLGAARLARVGGDAVEIDVGDLLPASATPMRLEVVRVPASSGGHFLVLAVPRDHRDEALRELLLQLTIAGLVTIVITAVVGGALAQAALRPVERYRRRAADIAGGASGLRLDVPGDRSDEVTRLGDTLNEMLAALERSLDHERRFVNDASHELRTPLTLLKSRIQLARRRDRSVEEHERVLDELAVDVTRLAELAEQLLELGATTSAVAGPGPAPESDVVTVTRQVLGRREPGVEATLPTTGLPARIDPLDLERALTNLLDNAERHGRPPVAVEVRAGDPAGWTVVQVTDVGPGMDADLLARATDRFTRAPEARGRPGAGLGLALVAEIARRCGGELRLCSRGEHTSHGAASPVPCRHDGATTATLLLPAPA